MGPVLFISIFIVNISVSFLVTLLFLPSDSSLTEICCFAFLKRESITLIIYSTMLNTQVIYINKAFSVLLHKYMMPVPQPYDYHYIMHLPSQIFCFLQSFRHLSVHSFCEPESRYTPNNSQRSKYNGWQRTPNMTLKRDS